MKLTAAVAAAALILAALYAAACWLHPWARCPHCAGTGLRNRGNGKRLDLRPCRWCHGHRMRLRWGRRIFNRLNRLRHESH